MDPSFTEQREEFRENLTLGLIPALGKFESNKTNKIYVYYISASYIKRYFN